MKTLRRLVLVALIAAIVPAARGDIVVFRDGSYEEGEVKGWSAESVTMTSPYGDLTYPRESVYSGHRSSADQPGLEYYHAGMMLLRLHRKNSALQLFQKAGRYDKRYLAAGERAIRDYSPQRTGSYGRVDAPPDGDLRFRVPVYRVKCKLCSGTGKVEYTIGGIASLAEYGFPTGAG